MPFIGAWLKADYNKADTSEDLLNLMHKWFNESERTENKVKSNYYKISAQYLYSLLTNKSYESKDIENLIIT
ncbi:MAG: hypothetical protein BM557_02015 [Flavobacterium sp. MedPE-SWcel]|nr:MAG: hypothetical protein BM557_02015 [Flavobacterium sp. MedPE-SWcel]